MTGKEKMRQELQQLAKNLLGVLPNWAIGGFEENTDNLVLYRKSNELVQISLTGEWHYGLEKLREVKIRGLFPAGPNRESLFQHACSREHLKDFTNQVRITKFEPKSIGKKLKDFLPSYEKLLGVSIQILDELEASIQEKERLAEVTFSAFGPAATPYMNSVYTQTILVDSGRADTKAKIEVGGRVTELKLTLPTKHFEALLEHLQPYFTQTAEQAKAA